MLHTWWRLSLLAGADSYKLIVIKDQTEYKPASTCRKMEVQDVSRKRQASSVRVGEMCLRVGADDAGPVL